jgi:DNA-directed RNA polymerase subunit RPC12/RpoP
MRCAGTHLARGNGSLGTPALEDEMGQYSGKQYGMYRCPVCGHRDSAEVERELESVSVVCTYCGTPLEVSPRGPDSPRFQVQVAQAPAP